MKVLSNKRTCDLEYRQQMTERISKLNFSLGCACRTMDRTGQSARELHQLVPLGARSTTTNRRNINLTNPINFNSNMELRPRGDIGNTTVAVTNNDTSKLGPNEFLSISSQSVERCLTDAESISKDLAVEFKCAGANQLFKKIIFNK